MLCLSHTLENVVKPKPLEDTSKKQQVQEMFDDISAKYDFLNHLLSFGIDKGWRKKLRKRLESLPHGYVLDLATGTGDLAIELTKIPDIKILGGDLSPGMLSVAETKIAKLNLKEIIALQKVDSENMPFSDGEFDSVTISYGVRNFQDLKKGLKEMNRVTKKGGYALILEFSTPSNKFIEGVFSLYFRRILPFIGRMFSKNMRAYNYLPESVSVFPFGTEFAQICKECGYSEVEIIPLTFGVTTLYICKNA